MKRPAGLPSTIFSKKKSGAGFTLIEILVTVVISGILFGGGIAAYRGIGARQNLKQAGSEFQSNLRLIQEKNLSSKKPDGCDVLHGYKVNYVDNNTYSMQAICENGVVMTTNIDLLENVSFVSAFSTINFFVLRAEIEGAQTIKLQSNSLEYWVNIESKGVITGAMQ